MSHGCLLNANDVTSIKQNFSPHSQLLQKACPGCTITIPYKTMGVFVRNDLLNDWTVEVVDSEVEDILWLKLECSNRSCVVMFAVCYLPPMSSSRGVDVYERLSQLEEQVENYTDFGTVVVCGDFNSRCSSLKDAAGNDVSGKVTNEVKTEQGEALVDFLRSSGLCLVNGTVGQDNFTCISGKGCSVVDYCMVFQGDLNLVSRF